MPTDGFDRRSALKLFAGGAVVAATARAVPAVATPNGVGDVVAAADGPGGLVGLVRDGGGHHSVHALRVDDHVVSVRSHRFDVPDSFVPVGFAASTASVTLVGASVVRTPAPPLPPGGDTTLPEVSPPYGRPQPDQIAVVPARWDDGQPPRTVDGMRGVVSARWAPGGVDVVVAAPGPEGDHLDRVVVHFDDDTTEMVATGVAGLVGSGAIAVRGGSLWVAVDCDDGLRTWTRETSGWVETVRHPDAVPSSASAGADGRLHVRHVDGPTSAPATLDADGWRIDRRSSISALPTPIPVTGAARPSWLVHDGDALRLEDGTG